MRPASNPVTRLGVIGDVHAEDERLRQTLAHLADRNVDAIVCTGDIVDGAGCPDSAAELLCHHDVSTVRGNHDRWMLTNKARHIPFAHHLEDLTAGTISYLQSLPTQIEIETLTGKLLLCHGMGDNDLQKIWPGTVRMPTERSRQLDQIIEDDEYRYVINGHMHFRTMIHFENLTLINAGTLKGEHRPGFSIIDFEAQTVSGFEHQEDAVISSRCLPLAAGEEQQVWRNTQEFDGDWQPLLLFS